MKDSIRSLYAGDDVQLNSAITAVTDRAAEIRKRFPGAIKEYLIKARITSSSGEVNTYALAEAEKKLGLRETGKTFDDLTFDQFIKVLFRHPRAPRLSQARDVSELRALLEQVRDVRNRLAHFRGELSLEERRTVKFAAEWLESNLPTSFSEPAQPEPTIAIAPVPDNQDEQEGPHGSYAPLATHLGGQSANIISLPLTFEQIEGILGKRLPQSAFDHRAWWSNDPMKPQSAAWLDEGWRTASVSMTDRRLTFVRTRDREEAYIRFFAKLNARLATEADFPLRNLSSQGQNWLTLAALETSRPEIATINASFTRRKELRIELYLDTGDKDETKRLFEQIHDRKSVFEQIVGEPMTWERLDNRRASRIAIYTRAQILTDADSPTLVEWAAKRAVLFYQAFEPAFASGAVAGG